MRQLETRAAERLAFADAGAGGRQADVHDVHMKVIIRRLIVYIEAQPVWLHAKLVPDGLQHIAACKRLSLLAAALPLQLTQHNGASLEEMCSLHASACILQPYLAGLVPNVAQQRQVLRRQVAQRPHLAAAASDLRALGPTRLSRPSAKIHRCAQFPTYAESVQLCTAIPVADRDAVQALLLCLFVVSDNHQTIASRSIGKPSTPDHPATEGHLKPACGEPTEHLIPLQVRVQHEARLGIAVLKQQALHLSLQVPRLA